MVALWLTLLAGVGYAQGVLAPFQGIAHGYLENFSIIRNNTFKEDYHVASARYRVSLQLTGPAFAGENLFGLPIKRIEYFVELRPEYESIYDLSGRFGDRQSSTTSGRGKPVRNDPARPALGGTPDNYDLLRMFGYNPRDFEEIYHKSNLVIPHPINPEVSYIRRKTEKNAWLDLDASTNDLRFGRLEALNQDIYYPIREAYTDIYFDAFGLNWLRIGKQQHVWGKADFFRLQDIVNPVNFGDHFFIDLFDETRIPLWSVMLEHRFDDVGPFHQLAGSIVWVPDRYRPLAFGAPEQPWSIGFGRELDAFAFGNDLFGDFIFPGQGVNSALAVNDMPRWNLQNSGIGTKWVWLFGNVRLQLTDWFAYQDVPAFGWGKLHIIEIPGCIEALPPEGSRGSGRTVLTNPAATTAPLPVRINVEPNAIRMADAPIVASEPDKIKNSRYINQCGLTGELVARYRKQNTLGLSFDWFEDRSGIVIRSENSWTANALVTDTTRRNWLANANIVRWVMGLDRPTMIRTLNPYRSFFLSVQAFGTHLLGVPAGRFGNTMGDNDNFTFTAFALTNYLRDQLNVIVFGAYGMTGKDGTIGGNMEYLITNSWSAQLGATAFVGVRKEHDVGPFAIFLPDPDVALIGQPPRPFTETGFGIGHMQAGGSERNQMDEFWTRLRYRF
jgi:uncharacterized protein DUF1302